MSRSGYLDDYDFEQWQWIMWRGAVTSAFRGKRGQAFLREMLIAMDAMPEKKLISGDLIDADGCACALGVVAQARGIDVSNVDVDDYNSIHVPFGIANSMAREVMWMNDEGTHTQETPEQRFVRMRKWIVSRIGRHRVMVEGDL